MPRNLPDAPFICHLGSLSVISLSVILAAGSAAGMGRPIERVLDRRCRDILARAQLGEETSDADRAYLRRGCNARD
jgi:hypothetical protein